MGKKSSKPKPPRESYRVLRRVMLDGLATRRKEHAAILVALASALPGSHEANELNERKARVEAAVASESKALRDLESDYDFGP